MMEITFISMHDVTSDCKIVYASDSIYDVLGYMPQEVHDLSTFQFFHVDDLPLARDRYKNEVEMNHASSLAYVRVRNKADEWIICECVFSFVYDVIIAATTIYKRGPRSDGRAIAAPMIRDAFKISRESARYEMLEHLSAKFSSIPSAKHREPRAALILNRFTKSLTILYATHALGSLVGLDSAHAVGISFLDCIDPGCIDGAVDALNRAKENDSVAYMRFRWKNTNMPAEMPTSRSSSSSDSVMTDTSMTDGEIHSAVDIEAVVSCTSDGIIVVLRLAASGAPSLPARGLFAVPWSMEPLYPAPPFPDDTDMGDENPFLHRALDSRILSSIQEISVFVWSITTNQDFIQRYGQGTPGIYSRPPTPGLTDVSSPTSSVGQDDCISCTSGAMAVEFDSD